MFIICAIFIDGNYHSIYAMFMEYVSVFIHLPVVRLSLDVLFEQRIVMRSISVFKENVEFFRILQLVCYFVPYMKHLSAECWSAFGYVTLNDICYVSLVSWCGEFCNDVFATLCYMTTIFQLFFSVICFFPNSICSATFCKCCRVNTYRAVLIQRCGLDKYDKCEHICYMD